MRCLREQCRVQVPGLWASDTCYRKGTSAWCGFGEPRSMPPMHISWVDAGGFGKGATDAQTAGTVTKDINDDEVNRLVGEAMEAGKRLASLLDRKAEHVSTLTMLDEQHWDSVRRITETTEQLSYLTRELRSLDGLD